jgi:hypothetical protein
MHNIYMAAGQKKGVHRTRTRGLVKFDPQDPNARAAGRRALRAKADAAFKAFSLSFHGQQGVIDNTHKAAELSIKLEGFKLNRPRGIPKEKRGIYKQYLKLRIDYLTRFKKFAESKDAPLSHRRRIARELVRVEGLLARTPK